MISEEEKKRYCEATKCEDCLSWHKYCNSECCKEIFINVNPKELEKVGRHLIIKPDRVLSFSDKRYFQLRGVDVTRGLLRFKKERLEAIGNRIVYFYPCELLDNNLCKGHPDNKPEICRALTLETAKLPGTPFVVTDNCLFKYKCKEVKKDD